MRLAPTAVLIINIIISDVDMSKWRGEEKFIVPNKEKLLE